MRLPLWAPFLVAAAAVRLALIDLVCFDTDETFSLNIAALGWSELVPAIASDKSHPPLFYVLLKIWLLVVPETESAVRMLPLAFGLALVPLMDRMSALAGLGVADRVLVLAIASVSELLVEYATYTRMFAPLYVFGALSTVLCLQMTVRGSAGRLVWLKFGVDILLLYTHYWGAFFLLGQLTGLIACYALSGSRVGPVVIANVCALIGAVAAFAPWAALVLMVAAETGGLTAQIAWAGQAPPDAGDIAWFFGLLNGQAPFDGGTTLSLFLFGAPVALLVAHFVDRKHAAGSALALILAGSVFVPTVLTVIASVLAQQNLWGARHLGVVAPQYYALVAMSVAALPNDFVRGAFRISLLCWALIAHPLGLMQPSGRLCYAEIAAAIRSTPGVPVYVSERAVEWPVEYHVNRNHTQPVPVRRVESLAQVEGPEVWIVYREGRWPEGDPRVMAERFGFQTKNDLETAARTQSARALHLVRR